MKRKRFTEEQIIGVLKEQEESESLASALIGDVRRRRSIVSVSKVY